MIGKLDQALQFHQVTLNLRAQRQQMLASNIANADTPNYKARDIDFGGALRQALAKGEQGGLAKTSATHLAPTGGNAAPSINPPTLYRTVQQGSVDGNTVDMDVERSQFADNAMRYEAGVNFMSAQIRRLLTAIQGQ